MCMQHELGLVGILRYVTPVSHLAVLKWRGSIWPHELGLVLHNS